MTTALDRRRDDDAAIPPRLDLTPTDYRHALKRPLRLLPDELRGPTLALWTMHRHLKGFETALPLAGAVAVWCQRWGLRPDDAAAILHGMTAPGRMAAFKFAADLMTAIGAEVDRVIKQRRDEAEIAERREKVRQDDAAARAYRAAANPEVGPPAPKLADLLTSIGRSVTDG